MITALQLTFSNLPLAVLGIAASKEIAIVRQHGFAPVWDQGEPTAFFAADKFAIGIGWYDYEKTYNVDENPELVKWLSRQSYQLVAVQEVVKTN